MSAKFGLGRGLDSLLPTDTVEPPFDPTAEEDEKNSRLQELKVDDITPDADQPRKHFDEAQLQALADSIKEHGLVQPIVVVKDGKKYKIVAGERRWRASKLAGLETIPAIIRTLDAQKRLELSLIENVQRQDLNPIEIATVYAKFRSQFNMTNADIAKRIGKSESAIINTTRLLTLPDDAKHAMVEHKLSEGQMRPLVTLSPEEIRDVLPKIIEEGWSARKVEQYKVDMKNRAKAKAPKQAPNGGSSANLIAGSISDKLGTRVRIVTSARGSGEIVLKFKDKQEFEKLCSILTA